MEIILNDLKNKLDNKGFQFEASGVIYNPMQHFAESVSTKERIHSEILADLLNPNGLHLLGSSFLVNFLQTIGINLIEFQTAPDSVNTFKIEEIETEFYAPSKIDGESKKGYIDIFVRLQIVGKLYAVIIENKLNDAPDQPRQLDRYNDFVINTYKDHEVKTVYLPRIKCDYDGVTVIDATKLADIIDASLNDALTPYRAAIQAYSNYLRNISLINMIKDNAIKLSELSVSDIKNAKAIKEAYDFLPQAFAERLKIMCDEMDGYKAKISSDYSHYCYIWNENAYKETGLWLAVGFGHDWYRIYVVSDNESMLNDKGYESKLHVIQSETSKGKIWLAPQETSEFEVTFVSCPVFEKLQKIITQWLKKLDEVALIK